MASPSNSPSFSKLHNFNLPEHWGDDSQSVVTRRSRSYKPPSPEVLDEDFRQRAVASETILNFRNNKKSPCCSSAPAGKRSRLVIKIPAVMNNAPIEMRPGEVVVGRGNIQQVPQGQDLNNDINLWEFRLPPKTRVLSTPAQEPPKEEKKRGGRMGITIPLTRREIEEDIFALTGRKPNAHPTKYSRRVQRVMDDTFPGLSLGCITCDKYKVSGPSKKKRRR